MKRLLTFIFIFLSLKIQASDERATLNAEAEDYHALNQLIRKDEVTEDEIKRSNLNLNARNATGESVFLIFALQGLNEKIEMLTKTGANKNMKTNLGNAFHYVLMSSREEVSQIETIRTLIRLGVNINETNGEQKTPLDLAVEKKKKEVIQVLKKEGQAELNAISHEKLSSLGLAEKGGSAESKQTGSNKGKLSLSNFFFSPFKSKEKADPNKTCGSSFDDSKED